MYLKHLKFLHTLLGLVLITGYLTSYTLLTRLYPDVYPNQTVIDILLDSNNILLLVTATANLLLGTYLVALHGSRRLLQMTGSVLIILSGLSAASVTLGRLPQMPGDLNIALLPLSALLAGLAAHLLCNLRALNPKTRLIVDTSDRETGTVKWFNISKGFGFITRDQGEDVFVHYRAIRGEGHRTLAEGQRVEFIVTKKEKGLQAEDVISAPAH